MTKTYLQPVGILSGADAAIYLRQGRGLSLAGGPFCFTALHLISSDQVRVLDVIDGAAPGLPDECQFTYDQLITTRAEFSGLPPDRPRLMGILNITPDSFSDGGRYLSCAAAIAHGHDLVRFGADMIDIGGESTRPGADKVPPDEELARVIPVVEALRDCGVPISVDTRRASVMRAALQCGATVINDVSALTYDGDSLPVVANSDASVILMHAQGTPDTMQLNPRYDHVLLNVFDFLAARVDACVAAGIPRARIAIDPGIGFGKSVAHNLALIEGLAIFQGLGCQVLVGASRKSFIGALAHEPDPARRLPGSLAVALAALTRGAQWLRVHDVAETRQAVDVWYNMLVP